MVVPDRMKFVCGRFNFVIGEFINNGSYSTFTPMTFALKPYSTTGRDAVSNVPLYLSDQLQISARENILFQAQWLNYYNAIA